jgi:uncharacterized membrane protein YfhO
LVGTSSGGTLVIRRWDANDIELDATTSAPAYLVLSEVFYPGWRAEVDGRASAVLPANFAFRAVYLEPGTHHVKMFFLPTSWIASLAISVATACSLLVVAVLQMRRAKTW